MEKLKKLYRKVVSRKWQVVSLAMIFIAFASNFTFAKNEKPFAHSKNELIEKKKTITYSYPVSATDKVSLDNQFGDIKVNLWDKNEVKVDITITANANNDARAAEYIAAVDVTGKKNDGQVSIKTFIDQNDFGNNWNNNGEKKQGLRVDYQVFMPKTNALRVKNSFGNITLPDFTAQLDVDENYGNFTAEDLKHTQNDVDVQFGKAFIKTMNGGKLKMSYSNLSLDKGDNLSLYNSFGKFDIKEMGKFDGKISYSSGLIGVLKESAKIKMEFSGGIKFGSVAKTVDNLEINSSYSAVTLPLENGGNYDFDVKVSYGGFNYPDGTTFTKNSDEDAKKEKSHYSYNPTKYYSGKIGKGGGKIIINSSFGAVKIQ